MLLLYSALAWQDGKKPFYWNKCDQAQVIRCLLPEDQVIGNSLQVAHVAHLLLHMRRPAGEAPLTIEAALEEAKRLVHSRQGPADLAKGQAPYLTHEVCKGMRTGLWLLTVLLIAWVSCITV